MYLREYLGICEKEPDIWLKTVQEFVAQPCLLMLSRFWEIFEIFFNFTEKPTSAQLPLPEEYSLYYIGYII